jgi:hypothetical protein
MVSKKRNLFDPSTGQSRTQRRQYTKSTLRKKVQTMTRGAAKRARKSIGF